MSKYQVLGQKAGSKPPRQPVIAPDSAQSKTYIKILYGLSEGEIGGLEKVYLDDTPTDEGNFAGLQQDFRKGTNDQDYIEGFPDISNETQIGIELKSGTPWTRSFTNLDLDAVRVRLQWGALRETNSSNGDVTGVRIEYAIDVQTDGSGYVEVLRTEIRDKTSASYERSHRIDLPEANTGWQVRVRRITPNSTSDYVSDKMYVSAVTEVIDLKLRYPNTALIGLQYDAETFGQVAKMAALCRGKIIKVPTNYNPENRTYIGMWDGTFKQAYSNNPAWIYYDICTSKRYGLGDRLQSFMIDKWSLYKLGQYCDEMVSDGEGGLEPRFTLNVYLQTQEDAYAILQKIAGVFRAVSFWDGEKIVCDADAPSDTHFTYTMANVIDGIFEYTGSRARDRHTVAKVAWDNPQNRFKTEYEFVRDEQAIGKLGVRIVDIDAWGCTSRGQAQRAGLWALKSEQLETRQVTFKVGLDGYIPKPYRIIEIADPLFAGRANGGRVSKVSADKKTITLDRDAVAAAGDALIINGEDGQAQRRIVASVIGRNVTVTLAFTTAAVENVWVIDAKDLATMKFRVMSVVQNEKHQFTITALQYNAQKYNAIDSGAYVSDVPISIINPTVQPPVSSVEITSTSLVTQGVSVETMVISYPQAEGAVKYQVEWLKDDGSWIKLPITGNNSVEVQGIYAGNYQARVTAINAFDMSSLPTYSVLTQLTGKVGLPPKLAFIRAAGVLFGMKLDWGFPTTGALDTAYTEIEVSPDGVSNIALLGQFSYPTNTHTIQGLQPNLRQFYRGRLIDRIGNVGEWSDWTSGTSTADADAVLELLNDQITSSQLDQSLRESIDKIGSIEDILGDLDLEDLENISEKVDGIYQITNPKMMGSTTDFLGSTETTFAGAWSIQYAFASEDLALSKRIDTVVASVGENTALIQQESIARVNADNALATQINTVQSDFNNNLATVQTDIQTLSTQQGATASQINTLQTTVNGNTASIQTQQQSIDGLNAQYTIKLDVNGLVGGIGLANSGSSVDFIVRSNKFAIAPPVGSGNAGKYAFVYQNTPTTLPNGTVVPAGLYVSDAVIGSISANKINAVNLSTITATIGVLRTATSGSRMEIRDNVIKCYEGSVVRVQLGNLDL